ncbi:MAG: RsmD family RNA methyltransferase [Flavobacteriaceae bacterium]|nr:RsmD family RNA methyltransferase [Flavobacteriaceae bacterium]
MKYFEGILSKEIQQFIIENSNVNLPEFLLKKSPFPQVSIQEIAQQIKGRQIAEKKFPFLLKEGIVFPLHLNIEQSSSQDTAEEKAKNLAGKSFLDLTCGFGVDAYFLSQNFKEITLVEQNSALLEIVKHNWNTLGRKGNFINDNLYNFLKNNSQRFNLIYLDPARRDAHNNKKFLLEDLSPNILEIQNQLLNITDKIIIKLSPLIDLTLLQKQISFIQKIEIIAVKNEVKEILLHIVPNFNEKIEITAKNLHSSEPDFSFYSDEETNANTDYSDVLEYIYIPNNAVLKSGAFNLISNKFELKKLHPNTHIYTSNDKLESFCGRIFKIEKITPKSLKKGEQFNIISKNHPLSPEQIKAKYQLKSGGKQFLIFTQSVKGKIILKSS